MPPKKSEKTVAAETKKKNVAEATEIVALMKRTSQREKTSSKKRRSHAEIMESLFDSAKAGKSVDSSLTEKTDAVAQKNDVSGAKEIMPKQTPRNENAGNSRTTDGQRSFASVLSELDSIETGTRSGDFGRATASTGKSLKMQPDRNATSSTLSNRGHGSKIVKKGMVGHGNGYRYEIDCTAVADTIDVTHLKRYLESQLKVGGQKNNLGTTIKVCCEGHRVVVESKVYLPKKALRFLSRNFLKKNWNIRVASKNKNSYEYKYVGTV